MRHLIEFRANASLPIERKGITVAFHVERGASCEADVRCYVIKTDTNYVEVADIEMLGGTIKAVPCQSFKFIDKEPQP